MEDNGEHLSRLPSPKGSEVLRPGVQLVSEPWDPPEAAGPDEEEESGPIFTWIGGRGGCVSHYRHLYQKNTVPTRTFGKSIQQMNEAIARGVTIYHTWEDEAADPLKDLQNMLKKLGTEINKVVPPKIDLSKPRDFRPPRVKEQEPYYIRFEKKKRR